MTDDLEQKKTERLRVSEQNKAAAKAAEDAIVAQYPASVSPDKLSKVQYRHNTWHGVTYAVIVPTREELHKASMQLLGGGKEVGVVAYIGIAMLNASDRDQYNKRVGRAVAASKLRPVVLKLLCVNTNENKTSYYLGYENVSLDMYLTHGKDNPFLSDVSDATLQPYHWRLAAEAR